MMENYLMTNRKRWSRATVAVVFSVMTILGATACYAWIQQERATNEARRAYAVAQNYTAQSNSSGLSVQNAPAQANYSLTPNASRSVSFAKVVHNSLPLEQHTLVKLIRSTPKEGNSEKKTEARNQLMRLVEQELDSRFASQAAELSLLEKRVAEAKEKLAQRMKRKEEIMERRVAELLSEPDDLAWNADINVPNANDPLPSPLLSLPVQPSNSLQSTNYPPAFQSAPHNANLVAGPAASPGSGTPLNFSVPVGNPPSELIPPSSATEPKLPLYEPALAANTRNDIATLLEEAIDLESEFEELDGLTPEGKIEAVQRLTLRKRLRKLELGLEAAVKKTEIDCRLLSSSLDLALKEYVFSEQEFVNTKELYNKGAASILQFKTHELELERLKQKVTTLEQELEAKSDGKESVSERIQRLRNKMVDILETQKPAPEVNY
jgi:hypothetical protein